MFSAGGDFRRPGTTRSIAEAITARDPAIFAIHGIDAGDALSLATRFDREWAYRGRQALFWRSIFRVHEVHDRYLPVHAARPFERRGFLEVRGEYRNRPLTLIALKLAKDRTRIRDLRFLRTSLRTIDGAAILFIGNYADTRVTFTDLAFEQHHPTPTAIFTRAF